MRIELVPEFYLTIDGDNGSICTALHQAGLTAAYDAFLEARDPKFEDDPSDVIGSIPIKSMQELAAILKVLPEKYCHYSLTAHGGDKKAGFNVTLGKGNLYHKIRSECHFDGSLYSEKVAEIGEVIRRLLNELQAK